MSKVLLHPGYFPSVSTFVALAKASHVVFETGDHFQKQTHRNRMYIYSPNGLQLLNVPIKHVKEGHQKMRDVRLETAFDWQKQHYKSLEAAYRTSPFFEYFEDDLRPIFEKKHVFLWDLNYQTLEIISHCLGLDFPFEETEEYHKEVTDVLDFRFLIQGKKDPTLIEPYVQVFGDKHGFLNNLSILDLLFNEGRRALDYLKRQSLAGL